MNELEHWFRYDFLPRQVDGAIWKGKPIAEAALHFLREIVEERRDRAEEDALDY